jgi:hypothetical protein
MSKSGKSQYNAAESGPRTRAKNAQPSKAHGPYETGKRPENAQRKEGGMHETRKSNHSDTTKRSDNIPQPTKALKSQGDNRG